MLRQTQQDRRRSDNTSGPLASFERDGCVSQVRPGGVRVPYRRRWKLPTCGRRRSRCGSGAGRSGGRRVPHVLSRTEANRGQDAGGLLYDSSTGERQPLSDHATLVRAAQAGDRDAFDELYARFAGFVHAILLARVSHDAAGDLAQDVFLHAWRTIRSLREPAAFPGWIGAIARHRALDFVRRRPLETTLVDSRVTDASPYLQYEAAEALGAIRDLPEAYREPLLLRLVEGCSGREIAVLCGLTEESARVNLHRGFKLLRERLGARDTDHER